MVGETISRGENWGEGGSWYQILEQFQWYFTALLLVWDMVHARACVCVLVLCVFVIREVRVRASWNSTMEWDL